ncbi:MAG: aminotransferase class V-fold PLP-dependent enzyme [Sandaracinaceae bacterium]|nr:aminotransferase [Myxococcales bacterium]
MPSPHAAAFVLDPRVTFLNHGAFGACPRAVLEHQTDLRLRMEANPVQFLARELTHRIDRAREAFASFVGAVPEDLVFVRSTTEAVNTVLSSLRLEPGDELLTTDHAYSACRRALERTAEKHRARVVVAQLPTLVGGPGDVVDAIADAASARTRAALVDHITSPTALVMPIDEIVTALAERGIDTIVDGAHAPGSVPVDLESLGAAYYAASLHKWLGAPKGAALLHVRRDRQKDLLPLAISHGPLPSSRRPALWEEFDWTGTTDPTPWLSAPFALQTLSNLLPGGISALMDRNRQLARRARDALCSALTIDPPAPDSMLASMLALPLEPDPSASEGEVDPLRGAILTRHAIEVGMSPWPSSPRRALRISCPIYVGDDDIERLIEAVRAELPA